MTKFVANKEVEVTVKLPSGRYCFGCIFMVWEYDESIFKCRLIQRTIHGYNEACVFKAAECPAWEGK